MLYNFLYNLVDWTYQMINFYIHSVMTIYIMKMFLECWLFYLSVNLITIQPKKLFIIIFLIIYGQEIIFDTKCCYIVQIRDWTKECYKMLLLNYNSNKDW